MPGIFQNGSDYISDENDELNLPVTSLKEGLHVSELIKKQETEFEVRPNDDEDLTEGTTAESCFDFKSFEKVINLDMIDVEQTENDEDCSPFDRYRRKMYNLREDGKIKKYEVRQGVGSKVPIHSVVDIRYQAYVEYAEVPFDSTLWQCHGEGDRPVSINLAKGQLLVGLYEGILSMRKGEKAEFLVHPDLAYGHFGCPPRIPPDATVLFIVEIDSFVDCGDVPESDDLDLHELKEYSNVYSKAKRHYTHGNDMFRRENYSAAAHKYRLVINMVHNARLANEEEEKNRNRFLIKNYTNACVCYKKLKSYKRICTMASEAMRVDEKEALKNYKLLYFWGYAKMMLGDFNGAKKHLLSAQKLQPRDKDIASTLKELEKKKSDSLQQEKIMMRKAFGYQPASGVKITEVDEEEEEFRKTVHNELEKFRNDPGRDSLLLKDQNFTAQEEAVYLQVGKELGLYCRVIDGGKRKIHITKPADF